jgi:hypothetical protein
MKLIVACALTLLLMPAITRAQGGEAPPNPPKPKKKQGGNPAPGKLRFERFSRETIPPIGKTEMKRITALPLRAANGSLLLSAAPFRRIAGDGQAKDELTNPGEPPPAPSRPTRNDAPSAKRRSGSSNPGTSSLPAKVDIGRLKSAINGFFATRYQPNYRVLRDESDDTGGAIDITVENIQGEITKEKLWEKITMFTVFYVTDTGIRIHLVVDAKVASGGRPPGDRDYSDLDRDYFLRLQEYTKALLTEMARHLEGK